MAWSTVPWASSSYSILVNRTLPNMVKAGHECTLGTWYGLQGRPLPWQIMNKEGKQVGTVQVLPSVNGASYDVETIIPTYEFIKADCLMTICDVWVFKGKHVYSTNFCPWLPIDMDPVPQPIIDALEPAIYPMIYSKWGVEMLAKENIKAHYVPCSVPCDVYKPGDMQAARKLLGFPDSAKFIVSMVAANKDPMDRKGFAEGLLGFAKFAMNHPDAYLYLHTNIGGGMDIKNLIIGVTKLTGFNLIDRILLPNDLNYAMGLLDDKYMVAIYQSSNVLLNPAKSEGFGLPLVEAQACGCPILATDFSTTDELLFAGWKIAGQPDWANGLNSWRLRVNIDSVVDGLEEAYRNRDNDKLRQKGRNGAIRFDNDTVFNQYWKPALKDIRTLISKATVNIPAIPSVNGKVTESEKMLA